MERGFTLVEIAIVVLVLGILLASLLGPLSVRIEQQEIRKTTDQMEEIKEALYGYAMANGALPCPDVNNNGTQDRTGSPEICSLDAGNIPWVDLGVPGLDAWNRAFRYRVTGYFADQFGVDGSGNLIPPTVTPPPACTATPAQTSFALCTDGGITVRDGDGGNVVAAKVAGVVISHGKYRFDPASSTDPPSPHEVENFEREGAASIPGDTLGTVVARGYTGGSGQEYDDLVVWLSANVLKYRLVQAGRLP
ncbi:MAG: type II secretion system GspH family protein [Pseudomonadota bacterium]|nr:type II secretion system protein [Gammaproteobacteria bacterium]MDQ3583815.1 type II secretion system GspH family protein [Pseudomonadota bacterium]